MRTEGFQLMAIHAQCPPIVGIAVFSVAIFVIYFQLAWIKGYKSTRFTAIFSGQDVFTINSSGMASFTIRITTV
jgi:hypothetical protein